MKRMVLGVLAAVVAAGGLAAAAGTAGATAPAPAAAAKQATATPIKHLVVIFQENVSFDHYFGTYPNAVNASGDPAFTAAPGHAERQRADPGPADPQPQLGATRPG